MIRVWTAAATLVLAGALAGCGEDATDPEDPVTETVTETVSPEPTPTETTAAPPTGTDTGAAQPTTAPATSAPAVDPSRPPTSYDEAEALLAAAVASTGAGKELRRFRSADDQFYCAFAADFVPPSCEILDAVRDLDTCADAPSPNVGRIELTRRGWAPFCNTDTIRETGAPVLEPGRVVTWPASSVECVLEDVGLTCLQTDSRQGFFLGSGGYQVF